MVVQFWNIFFSYSHTYGEALIENLFSYSQTYCEALLEYLFPYSQSYGEELQEHFILLFTHLWCSKN